MNKHLRDGDLQAYLDQALSPERYEQVEKHLSSCQTCQSRLVVYKDRLGAINQAFAGLDPDGERAGASLPAARARLQIRIEQQKEIEPMWNKLTSRRARPALAVVLVMLLLVLSMAFAPVRVIANNFLGLFRVQKVAVVPVDPNILPAELGSSSQLEALMSDNVQIEDNGEMQQVTSAAEASALAGISVRLPVDLVPTGPLMVQPNGRVTMTMDVPRMRAILQEIGRSDIQIPNNLDGEKILVDVPAAVIARYGECEPTRGPDQGFDPDAPAYAPAFQCTVLTQMQSPTVTAPPDLDVNQIGQSFLEILGMSPEEAASFAQTVDWTTTFVIPVPRYGTAYEDVVVDGVPATLIMRNLDEHPDSFMLLWVKDDIVYALAGPGGKEQALAFASTLQ